MTTLRNLHLSLLIYNHRAQLFRWRLISISCTSDIYRWENIVDAKGLLLIHIVCITFHLGMTLWYCTAVKKCSLSWRHRCCILSLHLLLQHHKRLCNGVKVLMMMLL